MAERVAFRRAGREDRDLLVRLRIRFLKEMEPVEALDTPAFQQSVRRFVETGLTEGRLVVWLAQRDDGEVVATAWICYYQKAPHPRNPSGVEGFILNVHTSEAWRHQGLATALVTFLIDEAKRSPARVIRLVASESGKGIYAGLGFIHDEDGMKLNL